MIKAFVFNESPATILSGALGEVSVTGSLEFAKDAEPNAGHLNTTNSDLILSASTGIVQISGNLHLNVGEKLVLDGDEDSDTYITVSGVDIMEFWAGGKKALQTQANSLVLVPNDIRFCLGTSANILFEYDSVENRFKIDSTDVDGGGTNGTFLWVEDGSDDVRFSGSTMFAIDAGPNSAHIISDNSDLIFSSSAGSIVHVSGNLEVDGSATVAGTANLNGNAFVSGFVSMLDNKAVYYGNGNDYWTVYDPTPGNFELWHTNVDGGGTDGVVLWVEDGTDDTHMSGNLEVVGQIYGKNFTLEPTGSNPSIDIDWNSGSFQTLILASASLAVSCSFSNAQPGASYALAIVQNDVAIDVNWPTVKWENGTTPTVTATAAAEDVFTFVVRSASEIYGTQGSNFS